MTLIIKGLIIAPPRIGKSKPNITHADILSRVPVVPNCPICKKLAERKPHG